MKRLPLCALFLLALCWPAAAQFNNATWIGPITAGDCIGWASPGVIKDAGVTCAQVIAPAGTNGQIQYNNNGVFGGLTVGSGLQSLAGSLICSQFGSAAPGCVPLSGGGTVNFLRADGTWAPVQGANPTASVGTSAVNGSSASFMRADAAPPINQAMAPTWSGVHKWTNDALFGSGRPWCDVREQGAVGDSSTNDTAAFNACVTQLHTFGGGIIFVPVSNGNYCLKGIAGVGFTLNSSDTVAIVGAGRQVSLSDCNTDVTTVTLQGPNSSISNISVKGRGADSTDTFTINHDAILMQSNCSNCLISHVTVSGGLLPIHIIGGGQWLVNDTEASMAYGSANIYAVAATNGGVTTGWIWRSFADDSFPTGTGPVGTAGTYTISAWAAAQAYAANKVVSNSGYYIQCTNCDGVKISGLSAPTNPVYGASVTDNQLTWKLLPAVGSCNIQLDSGNTQTIVFQTDATGPHLHNICVTDSQSFTPKPSLISIISSSPTSALSDNILLDSGNGITIAHNNPIDFCYASGCAAIDATANFGQGLNVVDNLMYAGSLGVVINAASGRANAIVSNNQMYGFSTEAILVQANITDFTISSNQCGTSGQFGTNAKCYQTSSGDDQEIIVNNNTHGSTNASSPLNGAGSANSTVTGNLPH